MAFSSLEVYKETRDNKVVHHYFGQAWKLPAVEIVKLKASGIVTVDEK